MNMHAPMSAADQAAECEASCARLNKKSTAARRTAQQAAAGFPALAATVNAWCELERQQNELGVAHNIAEHGEDEDAIEADDALWQPALRNAEMGALAVLNFPVTSIAEAIAKHSAFDAIKAVDMVGEDEDEIRALRRDLHAIAHQPPHPPTGPNPDDTPWNKVLKFAQDLEDADEDGDEASEQRAEAEVALIRTPAPNARAVAEKVRRMALTMEPGSHNFDAAMADAWLHGPADWEQRCAGAIYLDLLRLGGSSDPAMAPSAHYAEAGEGETAHYPMASLAADHATASAWQAARQAFLAAQARHEALDDFNTVEAEGAFTAQLSAEMTYAQTPPPNLKALATMLRDVLNFDALPGNDDRADKRESIQKLLNDDEPGMNYLGMAYQHATRLAGEVSEIHEARRGIPTQRGLTDEEFNARVLAQSAAA